MSDGMRDGVTDMLRGVPPTLPEIGWMVGEPLSQEQFNWVKHMRGGPPLEPSQEAKRAAFIAMYERKPEVSSGGGAMLWSDQLRWRMLTAGLSAAYAIDGLRAVPSQESGPTNMEE